jgi:hypothetical protein
MGDIVSVGFLKVPGCLEDGLVTNVRLGVVRNWMGPRGATLLLDTPIKSVVEEVFENPAQYM